MDRLAALALWPLRVVWVALALVAAGPVGRALSDHDHAVALAAGALAWLGWTVGLVALLVPRTTSLTATRIVVPAGAALACWSLDVAAAVIGLAALLWALAPWVTDAFVDGSSYGPERRFALRTPVTVATVAVATWAAAVAGATVGPLLLAAQAWAPGAIALLLGVPVAVAGVRSMHQLSRRWLVLVPTGMVLHDPLTMPEAQLFLRQTMAEIGPAPVSAADDDATEDLTAGASGLVLELVVTESVELLVRTRRRATSTRSVDRVLFSPVRPGPFLVEAQARHLPVG